MVIILVSELRIFMQSRFSQLLDYKFLYAGKNFLNWFGPKAQLVITEPELVQEVLNNKEGSFEKK